MVRLAIRQMWSIKIRKGTSGKKGQPGRKAQYVNVHGIVPYNEKDLDNYQSVWTHPSPDPNVMGIISDSGFGGVNLLMTFLMGVGFTQEDITKITNSVKVYSPHDMNKVIGALGGKK